MQTAWLCHPSLFSEDDQKIVLENKWNSNTHLHPEEVDTQHVVEMDTK